MNGKSFPGSRKKAQSGLNMEEIEEKLMLAYLDEYFTLETMAINQCTLFKYSLRF